MKKCVVAVVLIAVALAFALPVRAELLYWTGSLSCTDNTGATGTWTATEMSQMIYYIRIDKPNPKDTTGRVFGSMRWYYIGERRSGVMSWPSTGTLGDLMRSYGFTGQTLQFTVSQAFKDADGIERDSALSVPLSWTVPRPFFRNYVIGTRLDS